MVKSPKVGGITYNVTIAHDNTPIFSIVSDNLDVPDEVEMKFQHGLIVSFKETLFYSNMDARALMGDMLDFLKNTTIPLFEPLF